MSGAAKVTRPCCTDAQRWPLGPQLHLLLGLADIFAHQVAGLFYQQRFLQRLGNVFSQGSLAGTRCAVKTQRAVPARAQRLYHPWYLETRLDVEHGQVVVRHHAPRSAGVGIGAQRQVGVLELSLDQLLGGENRGGFSATGGGCNW